jgi:hypothetical protein
MLATIPAQPRSNFFLRSRALLLFLIFVIAFALLLAASIHYSNATHFTVSDGNALTIIGAPGELVTITINVGTSIEGDWATSGVNLSLNTPAVFSTQLVATQDPTWSSDGIATDSDSPDSEVVLSGSFTIPSNIDAKTQAVTGVISGNVLFPEDDGSFFTNTLKPLDIPVQVTLISASEVLFKEQLPLYLSAGGGLLILLALPAFFYLSDSRHRSPFVSL